MADADAVMAGTSPSAAPLPSCPFQKVPLEVLLRITSFLTTPELGKVRLTCRSIEQSLDTTFIKEFFTRKQFMLSDDSLEVLIAISRSRLGVHLRIVHFGLDRYPATLQHADAERDRKLRARHAGMFTLWSTGYHRDMLTEAFRNLKNLEDVVIRDFNSAKRTRDGPYRQWTSYGSTTASVDTGILITQDGFSTWNTDFSAHFGSQVFAAALMALGQAGSKPKGIEVMSRKGNQLKMFAFNISSYMEKPVLPVLHGLEKLHIDVDLSWRAAFETDEDEDPYRGSDSMLRKFLSNTTNVRHLRINEVHSDDGGVGALLKWLARPASTRAPSPAATPTLTGSVPVSQFPAFAYLEELNLGLMNVEASWVLDVVRKLAPTLKRLELWKLTLLRPLPDNHMGSPPKVNFWAKFFERLKDIPGLELHHLMVGNIQQQWRTRPSKSRVSFKPRNFKIAYTGTDWKHFVGEVIPKIEVTYAHDEGNRVDDSDEDGDWDLYALDL
ncbi:hypothetical protein EDB81DRAFT_639993 [Dactylonectria macrodidyma]|uniref:F-box domain-containing protein n=1 Tax=Dactylonectria macrodidyma TaxID=307937 RepID=A0A9P9JFW7_9HYPO|nr:hypothetical protein EDB81DRAFT_639993 [Dactylonectria macrodidyma]